MAERFVVNGKTYQTIKLLGHGKGGYSYLVEGDKKLFVLKQIHHEPCDYYQFGDKMQAELHDYQRLSEVGIHLPKLIAFDLEQEIILKEYIDGPTIAELVEQKALQPEHIEKVFRMQNQCITKGLNIDYYPTNFIVQGENLYYIDYECNLYDPKWDFDHWGAQYWKVG